MAYLCKRMLLIIPQMILIITFVFILVRIPGGDPVAVMVGPVGASKEYMDMMHRELGLDRPLVEQYLTYMSHVLRGDLGYSFTFQEPVIRVISERLLNTILLAVSSSIFAILLGLALGVKSSQSKHALIGTFSSIGSLVGYATPSYILGLFLLLVFSYWLPLFPLGGMATITSNLGGMNPFLDLLRHLVLPTITLGTSYLALVTRITKDSMLEVLGSDFILFARSKGLPERTVVIKHALRNALLPVTTAGGYAVARLLTGAVLTETVFAWPGLGRLVYDALLRIDYPVLIALFIYFGLISISINLVVDIIYVILDPRIKYR